MIIKNLFSSECLVLRTNILSNPGLTSSKLFKRVGKSNASVLDGILVVPIRFYGKFKITAEAYIAFLEKNFKPWFKRHLAIFKRTIVSM